MAFIKGYKYTTEQEAINARESCDTYYGTPVNHDDITQNWTEYQKAELNNPIFYYIIFDETLQPILGEPINFEVITPPRP